MNIWDQWMACLWRASWQSAVLAVVVLALTVLLRGRLPAGWRCGLWMLVAIRLMLPVLPSSRVSVFNLLDRTKQPAPALITPSGTRTIVTVGYGPIGHDNLAAISPPDASDRWLIFMAALWALGLLILTGRRIILEARAAMTTTQMPQITDQSLLALVERCCAEIKIRRRVRVVGSNVVRTPAVCGFWRATLILPADLAMNDAEWRMVVLHELAHVWRWDLQVDRLLSFVRDVHWFNPAAWIMLRGWRREREMACDETVLRIVGVQHRQQYGRLILELVEQFSRLPQAAGTAGLFASRSDLRKRIGMIGAFEISPYRWVLGGLLVLGVAGAALTDAEADRTPVPTTAVVIASTEPNDQITRVYDVSDLVARMPAPPKRLDTSMDDMEAQFAAKPDPTKNAKMRETMVEAISKTLHDAVPANLWKDKGGNGSITAIPGQSQIIVTQSPAAQDIIAKLLETFRHASGRQINIESRFLVLTSADLRKINLVPGEAPADKKHAIPGAAAYLSDEQVKTLLQAVQSDQRAAGSDGPLSTTLHAQAAGINMDSKHPHFSAPRLTVYNNQEAYVAIETQSAYVSGYSKTNVRGKQEYKPQTSVLATGDTLQVVPTTSPDEKYVTIWIRARQKRLVELKLMPWKDDTKLQFQQPVVDVHEGHSVISIPNNATLMMQLNDTATETPGRSNWILLRPQIIEAPK